MEKVINLTPDYLKSMDKLSRTIIEEKISAGPKKTRIIMKDDTGRIIGDLENKIVVTGSMFNAMASFGVKASVSIPNYNTELGLDNTLDYSQVDPKNNPIVCLFCVGDSGCGTTPKDVFTASYVDRIDPNTDILPFRYVDIDDDLDDELRKYYFGRKTLTDQRKIAYYFKSFDSDPQLHMRYTDGTQITEDIYNVETSQAVECYVETRLRITRLDFRDYFDQVRGWDNARISTLSLCYAWYDDTIDEYKWYQQIYPYSKLNFSVEWLVDLTKAIDFVYQVYY